MGTMRKDEPGAASQPEGDGPVELSGRTEPGGEGSPDTNQATAEPMSPTPDHPQPAAAPTLEQMNVGSDDAQSPSHPAGSVPAPDPAPVGRAAGEGEDGSTGTAQRAPGSMGQTPAGEDVEVDLGAGAERMDPQGGPGDRPGLSSGQGSTGPSPGSAHAPLEGSSEEQQIVTGARLPDVQQP